MDAISLRLCHPIFHWASGSQPSPMGKVPNTVRRMRLMPHRGTIHLCPSGAVQDGMHCTSLVRAYPSLGFRLAAFPYGEGGPLAVDEVTPTGRARLRPPVSVPRPRFRMALSALCLKAPILHLASGSQPSPLGRRACRGRWPQPHPSRFAIHLPHRGRQGRRQRSEQGSIASAPARCEATIANLTAAKQEVARQRRMRSTWYNGAYERCATSSVSPTGCHLP